MMSWAYQTNMYLFTSKGQIKQIYVLLLDINDAFIFEAFN